jgi:hypothetical protein
MRARDAMRLEPSGMFIIECTNACLKVLYYPFEWRCQEQHGREMDAVDKRGSRDAMRLALRYVFFCYSLLLF